MAKRFYQPHIVECTPGCGQLVSVDAKTCPKCGDPDPARIGGVTKAESDWWASPEGYQLLKEKVEREEAEMRRVEQTKFADKKFRRWFQLICGGALVGCAIMIFRADSFASIAISLVVGFFLLQGLLNASEDDD